MPRISFCIGHGNSAFPLRLPVTGFALASRFAVSATTPDIGIARRVLVALRAVCFVAVHPMSVAHHVIAVIGTRAPPQIFYPVVFFNVIPMATDGTFRPSAHERFQHEHVNKLLSEFAAIVKFHAHVPFKALRLQYPTINVVRASVTADELARQGTHRTPVANFVQSLKSDNRFPRFLVQRVTNSSSVGDTAMSANLRASPHGVKSSCSS